VFPVTESDTFEFKASLDRYCQEKITPTLCGFLNNKGGYMVFGVTDDGKIKGLRDSRIAIDKFLLSMDSIYHQGKLTYDNGEIVAANTIQTRVVELPNATRLIVITATPAADKKYMCSDGSVWVRLSASNYRVRTDSVRVELARMTSRYDAAKTMIHTMRKDAEALLEAAKKADAAAKEARALAEKNSAAAAVAAALAMKTQQGLDAVMKMVETDILKRKEAVEAEHEAARRCSWWSSFTCGIC
jgi:predicted HTH transcriptional regulator